ncbi:MAG: hypothetical protein ABJN22_13530 [Litorimonas sp.]
MKQPKKSETLEVRLSHPDKVALQNKAANEGRTVSDVVRGLISSYLSQTEPRSHPLKLTELLMTLKSKPKSVLATLAVFPLLATPFLLPTAANAGDISLTLESEFIEPVVEMASDGNRVRRSRTEIHIAEGQFFSLPVAASPSNDPNAHLYMSLRVSESDNHIVIIEISICEKTNDSEIPANVAQVVTTDTCVGEKLIANPKISAKYGETAEFRMETEYPSPETANKVPLHEIINGKPAKFHFDSDKRRVFKLKASPKKV